MTQRRTKDVAIWDWPVRICHWLFVLLIPLAWWTAEEHMFEWHQRIGLALLTLLVFRLIWGLIGSSTARFTSFIHGPAAILRYVRGGAPNAIGHNPLGGLSVAALLLAMTVQVGLGLFATDDDGMESGPLNHLIGYEAAETVSELHELNFNIILGLVALHVGAILFYAVVKRSNLLAPMITGVGQAERDVEPMRPGAKHLLAAAIVVAFAFTWWVWQGAPT